MIRYETSTAPEENPPESPLIIEPPKRKGRKTQIYRVGDWVQIVEPVIVRRVGYRLGMDEAMKAVRAEHINDLGALVRKLGGREPSATGNDAWGITIPIPLMQAAAHAWLSERNFGGNERTLHTEIVEYLRGQRTKVNGKRVVKTGVRRDSSPGWGDYDGGSPELTKVRTHVLLSLCVPPRIKDDVLGDWLNDTEIEETNVVSCPYSLPDALAIMQAKDENLPW